MEKQMEHDMETGIYRAKGVGSREWKIEGTLG